MNSIVFKGSERVFTLADLESFLENTQISKNKGNNMIYTAYEASIELVGSQNLHIYSTRRRMKRFALIGCEYFGRGRRFNSSRPSTTMEMYIAQDTKGLFNLLEIMYNERLKESK
jgi:hypothetical protein